MTDHTDMTQQTDTPIDKLFEHHRQQLSAMLDGELPPDQAKFMLRRLEHDSELATCWERWQVCGDILRGRHDALLPADFSQRVASGIAGDQATAPATMASTAAGRQPKWLRWGGGAALAASVAMLTLLVTRQAPDLESPLATQPVTVAASSMSSPEAITPAKAATPPAPSTPAPEIATTLATAIAVAELPRRATQRRSRGQSQRAANRVRQQAAAAPVVIAVASTAPTANSPSSSLRAPGLLATSVVETNPATRIADPFATHALPPARPWPRAILPNFPANATFAASYGGTEPASATHPFHPFEPRALLESDAESTGAPDDQRSSGPR